MIVTVETPDTTDVAALLAVHEALMRGQTPAESCHVRSADDLCAANGQVYTLRSETGALLAIAALVPLSATHEELKSMHTAQAARGRGAGRALLDGMVADARSRGVTRISLETGSGPEHDAARALYAKAGFSETAPFADYPDDPLSTYMTRAF